MCLEVWNTDFETHLNINRQTKLLACCSSLLAILYIRRGRHCHSLFVSSRRWRSFLGKIVTFFLISNAVKMIVLFIYSIHTARENCRIELK